MWPESLRPHFVGSRSLFPEQSLRPSSHVSEVKTTRLRCKKKEIHDYLSWEAPVSKRIVTLERIKEPPKACPTPTHENSPWKPERKGV